MSSNVSIIDKPVCYTHLSYTERVIIQTLKDEGKSLRQIAKYLNRSHSTISRELRRNQPPKNNVAYKAQASQRRSEARRSRASRRGRLRNEELRECVISLLKERYSPELISGFLQVHTE